jgi:hypothetical protein
VLASSASYSRELIVATEKRYVSYWRVDMLLRNSLWTGKVLACIVLESSLLFVIVMSPRLHTAESSSSPRRCHKPALIVVVPAQLHLCSCNLCLLAHLSSSPLRSHRPALVGSVPAQLHSCSCHLCLLAIRSLFATENSAADDREAEGLTIHVDY